MKKLFVFMLAGVLSVSLLAACGQPAEETGTFITETPEPTEEAAPTATATPAATPTATATPAATPTATPTPAPVGNINPFTGVTIDRDISNLRPYMFMVNNISNSMPQVGISQADMIFELMDEGGITRMMALYADPSNVEFIGSIRSARGYNAETAYGYDAILAHCGNSDEASWWIHNIFQMEDMDQIDGTYGEDVFFRDPDRSATLGSVHSLLARGPGIVSAAAARGYRLEHNEGFDRTYGLHFGDNAAAQCTEDATHIDVIYSGGKTSTFEYDPATGQYTMYQYGMEYLDNNTEKVPFTNVIMIYANTYLQEDGQHLTIELDKGGSGIYFTGGRAVPITWDKSYSDWPYTFYLQDGTPLELARGKTFVAVNQSGSYHGDCQYS